MLSSNITFAAPFIILFLIYPSPHVHCYYPMDFCQIDCHTRTHTLCDTLQIDNCTYATHHVYNSKELSEMGLQDELILAHNGLRERIATRMHVANMVVVKWSKQMFKMAHNWAHFCQAYEDDECSHMGVPLTGKEIMEIAQGRHPEPFITMNRFCMFSFNLPSEIIQMAMREWYFEKDYMHAPIKREYETLSWGLLEHENNFTHLAYPQIRRIGCSVARYDNIFCVFCFYDPYYRHIDGMIFKYGEPATQCPSQYPIKDVIFPALCSRNLYIETDEDVAIENEPSLRLLIIILFYYGWWFLWLN